jgi:hypothetical protein
MAKHGRGPSQTWKTFLHNHAAGIAAMDFLIMPTVGFGLLYVLVILRHQRWRLISLTLTTHPTADWIIRQIADAFSWDNAPAGKTNDSFTLGTRNSSAPERTSARSISGHCCNPVPFVRQYTINCIKLVSEPEDVPVA